MKQRIVTIGGGSGQSKLLYFLKDYPCYLTALVSMVDDGGSTGRLRQALGVPPVGDIRQCLTALARCDRGRRDLFAHRFSGGDLAGHALGNLILAGMTLRTGNFLQAVQWASRWLECAGTALPISAQPSTLYARLANGQTIIGETNIDIPKHDARLKIDRLYLRPRVMALPKAIRAITQADVIILTIGDLYTSVLPNLLVGGIARALCSTRARIIYTCNRVTKRGETRGFSALDYVTLIDHYIGARRVDTIIVDRTIQRDTTTRNLVHYQRQVLEQYGLTVVEANVAGRDRSSIDGKKLAATIAQVCAL